MKYGVFSVSMPEYDIKSTVKVLKELGYNGIEWRVAAPVPAEKPQNYTNEGRYWTYNLSTLDINTIDSEAYETSKLCRDSELDIYSLTTYLTLWDTEGIRKVAAAANIMDCRNIRVNLPFYDEKENYNSMFGRAREQAKVIEKLAEETGVRVTFEIHMGSIIPSASAAYRFVSGFNPRYIGVIHDVGNMVHEGFENYKLGLELLGEYIANVHIKNYIWKLTETDKDGVDLWASVPCPLKKGTANIRKFVGLLEHTGYDGFLSVEDFSNEQDTYSKLKSNIQFLKAL